jgi:hypothetical protein
MMANQERLLSYHMMAAWKRRPAPSTETQETVGIQLWRNWAKALQHPGYGQINRVMTGNWLRKT